jgi:hypothetical protein
MKVKFLIELLFEVQGNYTVVSNSFMRKSIMQRLGITKKDIDIFLYELTYSGILTLLGKDIYSLAWIADNSACSE